MCVVILSQVCVVTLPQLSSHTCPGAISYLPRSVVITFSGVFLSCPGYSVFSFLPRCVLIPAHYQLVDFLGAYLPVCVSMFVCYGKILAIAWRLRQRIEPVVNVNLARGSASAQTMAGAVTQRGDATGTDNNQHPPEHAPSGTSVILVIAKDVVSVRSLQLQ